MKSAIFEIGTGVVIGMATCGILAFIENGEHATKLKEQQAIISILCEASPQCKKENEK